MKHLTPDNILRLATVALLAVLVFWGGCHKTPRDKSQDVYKDWYQAEKERNDSLLVRQDRIIERLLEQDSVAVIKINSTNDRIKQIPARVNRLTDPELIREITNFQ